MANITMSIDDELIKKVKKIAVEKNTTLTGLVREYLTRIAKQDEQRRKEVINELFRIMNSSEMRVGETRWSRDELHER
jgi:DNA-directed RNA polymerase subunit F